MSGKPAFLPYGRQTVDDDDIAAVTAVLRGDLLTTGPAVAAFEKAFAAAVGARHAVSCSSGTAALHLAALALGLGPGDGVVVPAITFLATANAARFVGAEVIFADVDPQTGLMEAAHLEDALEYAGDADVKAVFPVHMNGQCADLDTLRDVAAGRGLAIVEDACHAPGATFDPGANGGARGAAKSRSTIGDCRYGDLATFSFHPVKIIAGGEGGAVTTNDETLRAKLARFRSHGMTRDAETFVDDEHALDAAGRPNPWYYEMADVGLNYRLSDIHAGLALSQLGKLGAFVARRRALASRYDEALSDLAPQVRPVGRNERCLPAWHLYVALIDFEAAGVGRSEVMAALSEQGIGSQVHYFPVALQPYYRRRYGTPDLPGATAYYARCLSLPLFPAMADGDVDRVVAALRTALRL